VQTGNKTVNWPPYAEMEPIHVMGLSDNAICRKYGQEKESAYHILCQCPSLAVHRKSGSAWLEPVDVSRAAITKVLALALTMSIGPY
jgi:hypothetical protein